MTNLRPLKYSEPNERNVIEVMGYEPYFDKFVNVASIYLPHPKNNHMMVEGETFHILHSHGYFPKHSYGNKVVNHCKRKYNK